MNINKITESELDSIASLSMGKAKIKPAFEDQSNSSTINMTGIDCSTITKEGYPLVLTPSSPISSLRNANVVLYENRALCRLSLLKYGALLLRNFPIESSHDFRHVIEKLNLGSFMDYSGGDSPRRKVANNVYTSTDAPSFMLIPLHNELSYAKNYPKHISFYCEVPPSTGGETIIGDARKIYEDIDEEVRLLFQARKIHYIARYYSKNKLLDFVNGYRKIHKTWMDTFETDSRKSVEEKCKSMGFDYTWLENDWLQIDRVGLSEIKHFESGQLAWFNQSHLYEFTPRFVGWQRYFITKFLYPKNRIYHEARFADGSPIPRKYIEHILDVLDKNTVAFSWQKGDVLILDNISMMHGRAPFSGSRKILTAMTN